MLGAPQKRPSFSGGPCVDQHCSLLENYFFSGVAGAAGVCSCVAGATGASSFFVQPNAAVMAKARTMMSARIFFILFTPFPLKWYKQQRAWYGLINRMTNALRSGERCY